MIVRDSIGVSLIVSARLTFATRLTLGQVHKQQTCNKNDPGSTQTGPLRTGARIVPYRSWRIGEMY